MVWGAIVSFVAYIAADLGLSWFNRDSVSYVEGLDLSTFLSGYWLPFLLFILLMIGGIWLSIPNENVRGRRVSLGHKNRR